MQFALVRLLRTEGAPISLALILAVIAFTALNPAFLSPDNLAIIAVQSIFVMIIAIGMSFVLTSGAIDLSVGAVLGLSGGGDDVSFNYVVSNGVGHYRRTGGRNGFWAAERLFGYAPWPKRFYCDARNNGRCRWPAENLSLH